MSVMIYFDIDRKTGHITEHRPTPALLPPTQPTRRQLAARRRELEQLRRQLISRSIIVID